MYKANGDRHVAGNRRAREPLASFSFLQFSIIFLKLQSVTENEGERKGVSLFGFR